MLHYSAKNCVSNKPCQLQLSLPHFTPEYRKAAFMTEPALLMQGICKRFGATQALNEVNLQTQSGHVLALIGENGAGKSTLMKILSGAHTPDSGSMTIHGTLYQPGGPLDAIQAGVGMIYQELNLAPELSVEDNIMLGQEARKWGILQRKSQRSRVIEALNLLGHPELRPDVIVNTLSVGAQQLIEIARALVMEARIIIFDEPTSSLTSKDVQHLFRVIRRLKESGLAIIYISHFLEEVREVCDSYAVLRDGESVGSGKLKGIQDAEIVSLMVGRDIDELFPAVPHQVGETVLTLRNLTGAELPRNVTLELRKGEILGIGGLVGAGRTELLRCLFALEPVRKGEVKVANLQPAHSPHARIDAGLGFLSEDRKGEGLAQGCTIGDNLTLSQLSPYASWGFLNLRKREAAVNDWMNRLQVKAQSQHQSVSELSGGNQQKVALARVMHQDADILLFDEPTRGIDVGTKAEVYRLMGELAAKGKAILFVSSYLPELMSVCDRIGVMSRGQLQEIRDVADWTEEAIMEAAIGG